jgi:hypothetical protein
VDPYTVRSWDVDGRCDRTTGGCTYTARDGACPAGCQDGVCAGDLDLLQADLTVGGALDLTAGPMEGRCVMPGWTGTGTVQGGDWSLTGGFEP